MACSGGEQGGKMEEAGEEGGGGEGRGGGVWRIGSGRSGRGGGDGFNGNEAWDFSGGGSEDGGEMEGRRRAVGGMRGRELESVDRGLENIDLEGADGGMMGMERDTMS